MERGQEKWKPVFRHARVARNQSIGRVRARAARP
jgi:hypothetical protein